MGVNAEPRVWHRYEQPNNRSQCDSHVASYVNRQKGESAMITRYTILAQDGVTRALGCFRTRTEAKQWAKQHEWRPVPNKPNASREGTNCEIIELCLSTEVVK